MSGAWLALAPGGQVVPLPQTKPRENTGRGEVSSLETPGPQSCLSPSRCALTLTLSLRPRSHSLAAPSLSLSRCALEAARSSRVAARCCQETFRRAFLGKVLTLRASPSDLLRGSSHAAPGWPWRGDSLGLQRLEDFPHTFPSHLSLTPFPHSVRLTPFPHTFPSHLSLTPFPGPGVTE